MSGNPSQGGGGPWQPPGGPYSPYNPTPQPYPQGAPSPQFFALLSSLLQSFNGIATALQTGIPSLNTVPSYTFAILPVAPSDGLVVYGSDVRKPLEGPGAGTGMLCFSSEGTWYTSAGTLAAD